jgi:hypothetical protein
MGYLGNTPGESFISFAKQVFTIVNSQTAYTLNFSVVDENEIRLVINNVVQEPGTGKAYTASGTTLTLASALTNGTDEMYCVFLGKARETVTVPTITRDKLNLISDGSNPSLIAKGTSGVSEGYIQLNCAENSHGVKIKSPPHSAGQSYTLTLPQSITNNTFLKTDGSGNLSFAAAGGANTPAFSVRQTTNQTGLSSDTLTKISFQSEVFDTDNAFASDKFTVPSGKGGRYFFDASTRIRSGTLFQLRNAVMYFYKNGSAMGDQYSAHYNSNLMLESRQNYSFVDDASAGDYYEIYATGTVDSGTVNLYQTTFTGFKIIE